MRIFLTGGTGFVGAAVAGEMAPCREHQVALLVRPGANLSRIANLLPRVTLIEGDLARPDELERPLADFGPQVVVHLAWSGVLNSARNDPAQQDNVAATLACVRLAHRAGATHWIGLGSQAEYGPAQARIAEDTPTRPTTLYGVAKLAAYEQSREFCAALGMRHAWLRLFSSYGPGDNPAWAIPYIALSLLRSERPAVTACEQRWDYVYVDDAARAIALVALEPTAIGVFNLGSGRAESLRRVFELIRNEIDPRLPIGFGEVPYRPDQVMHLEANIARLRATTGWQPRVDLESGIVTTVRWYAAQGALVAA